MTEEQPDTMASLRHAAEQIAGQPIDWSQLEGSARRTAVWEMHPFWRKVWDSVCGRRFPG